MEKVYNANIITMPVGILETNCYIVYDDNKNGFVVDCGDNPSGIIRKITENDLHIEYILFTHCHYDHIGALEKVKEYTGAKVVISMQDSSGLTNPDVNLSSGKWQQFSFAPADIIIERNDTKINCGEFVINVIETPGHTKGGVTYCINGAAFTGDTLFEGDVGRWDLPGGNYEELEKSIRDKLYLLSDETKVYPGHGISSTIGHEKEHNSYVQAK